MVMASSDCSMYTSIWCSEGILIGLPSSPTIVPLWYSNLPQSFTRTLAVLFHSSVNLAINSACAGKTSSRALRICKPTSFPAPAIFPNLLSEAPNFPIVQIRTQLRIPQHYLQLTLSCKIGLYHTGSPVYALPPALASGVLPFGIVSEPSRYLIAACNKSTLSLKLPRPTLHCLQSRPRTLPVVWQ